MKKLSLKKTTLSRLNNSVLNNVKGGFHTEGCPAQYVHIETEIPRCAVKETGLCMTGFECETENCISIVALC